VHCSGTIGTAGRLDEQVYNESTLLVPHENAVLPQDIGIGPFPAPPAELELLFREKKLALDGRMVSEGYVRASTRIAKNAVVTAAHQSEMASVNAAKEAQTEQDRKLLAQFKATRERT
jgi:hypothetical protein